MAKNLVQYVDFDAVKARVKAAEKDLHSRLPDKDADGKVVNKKDHAIHPELVQKFVDQAVTAQVVDAIVDDLKAEMVAELGKLKV